MEGKTFKLSIPAIAGIVLAVAAITTAVVLLISGGAQKKPDTPVTPATPTEVAVPNVEGLERKDSEKLLANVHLDLGEITEEYSDTVARGHVISQDPKAGIVVKVDTPIQLVISKGAEKPTYVTMPDLIGKSHSEAEQALKDAQLVAVQGDPIVTTDVEPGKVCRQSIAAGAEVKAGTQVSFSTAIAPDPVVVPNLYGLGSDDAKKQLSDAGLGVDTATAYSDTVAQDCVSAQSVAAGTKVVKGTVVTITISQGKQPVEQVEVPDLSTFTLGHAIDALKSAGLDYRYSGEENGNVVSQDPAPGTKVDKGSTVTFTLQHQASLVEVPDVSGKSATDAASVMNGSGLTLKYDPNRPDDILSGTDPVAGALVDEGTEIEAIYQSNPDPVTPQEVGSWETNTDALSSSLTDDVRAAFHSATQGMMGASYEPIAVLATQVVDGTNYAILARQTTSDADGSVNWCIVTLSVGSDGNARISEITKIDPDHVKTASSNPFGALGGWTVTNPPSPSTLNDSDAQAYNEAVSQLDATVNLSPVACLSRQSVSGMNYLFLCEGDQISAVFVYRNPMGGCSVTSLDAIDWSYYVG